MSFSKNGRMQAWQRGQRQHLLEVEQKRENFVNASCMDRRAGAGERCFVWVLEWEVRCFSQT